MFEIRNYHFEPTRFAEYKIWVETLAGPYLREKMDVVGFWVTNEMAPEYGGSLPHDHNVVPANMTWIIRWQNKSHRDRVWQELLSDPEWQAIFSSSLRPEGYLRTEAKFATEI